MQLKEKKLSEKQISDLEKLNSEIYITVYGKMAIPEMTKQFGTPKAIMKYAKVEALTGLVSNPTIVVERFIDGELFFRKDLVVRGIPKSLLLLCDYNGIEVIYIRHPTYDPSKMVKASKKEIKEARTKKHN